MEAIIRNVRDIESDERRVLEHVIGQRLQENQKVIIQVVTLGKEAASGPQATDAEDELPEWFNVYDGLSEKEIDDLESVILQRADLTRPSP